MIHSCLLNHFEMPWPRSIPGESRIGRRVIIFTMGFLLAFVLELFSPAATSGQAFDQQPGQVAVASESLPLRTPPAIAAIGHIEPGDGLLQISATSYLNTFVLGKLFVAEGDFVPKGHVLAHLDAHGVFEAAVGVAQKALEATKERQAFAHRMMTVGEVPAQEARIQKLQAELAYLEADHKRTDFLRSRNLVSSAEQESTLSRRQAKTEEVQEAVHLHRSLKEKWAGELRQAEIAIGQAECALKRAQAEFALCQIRAPVAGRILEIHTREGEAIRSKGVLSLGETDRMYAVAEVYQADVPKIKPGAKARVTADGLGLELSGVVERIGLMVTRNQLANPDIAADIDSRVVKVRIRLDQPELVAGLTNLRVTIGIE
jgi:HlyD family secretion protein